MDSLLSPGMRLLGRFGFARKFQLLFLLFMLPLVGSLWMIGSDYRDKLAVIAGEQSGVRQLLVLEDIDRELVAQRDRAARWKAVDILREPTPEARQIMEQIDAAVPRINQALERLGSSMQAENASADSRARYKALQAAVVGMDIQSLGWIGSRPNAGPCLPMARAPLFRSHQPCNVPGCSSVFYRRPGHPARPAIPSCGLCHHGYAR